VDGYEASMRRALQLADRGWGRVSPNPLVGAVVLRDGEIVGEGWHEGPGTRHAEVMALEAAGPERSRGATVVCTLEPCDHAGRTPPCTRALIDAGVTRVVAATGDPNPLVDGAGFARLRAAGIDVVHGPMAAESRRMNEAFERHVTTGLPFVTVKTAATLDGKTAAADGTSKWITGEAARADVQRLRAGADAIVVGARTVIADDPALTLREPRYVEARPPLRVVVDTRGAVAPAARVFDREAPTLVATTERAPEERIEAWAARGAEVLVLDADATGRVSLLGLMTTLGKREVQGVLVEGGATLAWSVVREGLADKVIVYLAPKLAGGTLAPGILAGEGFVPIDGALPLTFMAVEPFGDDLRVEAYVHRDR
jgi:diaminohydroxyphosphoribosylaminopyrimidine deaminase / 5-amino-6-(5-phosphoribosylamino)uracil reductase